MIEAQSTDTIRVADLEWPWLASVDDDATVQAAATVMAEFDIGVVGVLHDGVLDGVISERDVVRACSSGVDLKDIGVTKLMSRSPHVISPSATAREAAMIMAATRVRHLPVVDGGRAVGMLSARDVLDAMCGYMELRRSRLRATMWNRLAFGKPKVRRA